MAEYIRFKWTRAKAGVTMAFLALLGGVVEQTANAEAARGHAAASNPATWTPKLSLNGITGNLRTSLVKIEKDFQSLYVKDDKAISAVKASVVAFKTKVYSKTQADTTFLTDKDATLDYLGKDGTAANSSELGGLSAQAFLQGDGGIATGTATATITDGTVPLVESADKALTVTAEVTGNGQQIAITNNTASPIDWINGSTHGTIDGGAKQTISLGTPNSVDQATVQFLPVVQNQAFTLIVSTEPGAVGSGTQRFVAQMLNGAN
jgi:hypothetical protein